jgi:hypothetical protein
MPRRNDPPEQPNSNSVNAMSQERTMMGFD